MSHMSPICLSYLVQAAISNNAIQLIECAIELNNILLALQGNAAADAPYQLTSGN